MRQKLFSAEVVEVLFLWIISLLCTFFCLFAFGRYLGIHEADRVCILIVPVVTAALSAWWQRPLGQKGWTVMIAVFVVFAIHFVRGFALMAEFWEGYVQWLSGMQAKTPELSVVYRAFQTVWLSMGVTILSGCMLRWRFYEWLLAAAAVTLLVLSYAEVYVLSGPAVAFALTFILFVYIGVCQRFWPKRKNVSDVLLRDQRYRVFLSPVLFLFLLILVLAPVKETPLEWTALKKVITRIENALTAWSVNYGSGGQSFEMQMSGLSSTVDVNGGGNQKGNPFMIITCSGSPATNLYLTGYVWQDFDGRQWQNRRTILESDARMDALETIYAVARKGGREEDALKYTVANVRYQYFRSESVFLPSKTYSQTTPVNLIDKDTQMLGYDSEYDFRCLQLNLNHPAFYAYLEQEIIDDSAVWDTVNYYQRKEGSIYSFDELLAYRERVRREYMNVDSVSEAVRDWENNIWQQAQAADPTIELTGLKKLVLLEQALSQFTYVNPAGEIPETVDSAEKFLDYFLLEQKEGYCTHFATAFVLLARDLGYPARLCQGFSVPTKGQKETLCYGSYAHAWPEVYFEGVGWIPFEPTPGYMEMRYTPWEVRDASGTQGMDWSGYFERLEEKKRQEEMEQQNSPAEEPTATSDPREILAMLVRIAIGITLVAVAVWLAVYFSMLQTAKKVCGLSPKQRLRWLCNRNLELISLIGFNRAESETLTEFGARIQALEEPIPGALTIGLLEQLLYREGEVTPDMLQTADQENALLLDCAAAVRGRTISVRWQRSLRKQIQICTARRNAQFSV